MTTVIETPTETPTPPLPPSGTTRVGGLLAEYPDVDSLLAAAQQVRDAGYTKWDCHSPFPVHGMMEAMGFNRTILPYFILAAGLTGCAIGLGFQLWANGIDYAMIISGKPLFAVPANIPIAFEFTILLSALTAFFGMFALNGLPKFWDTRFTVSRFRKFSDDGFFVFIDADDPKYDPQQTPALLERSGAAVMDSTYVPEGPAANSRVPTWISVTTLFVGLFAIIPLAFFIKSRFEKHPLPRIHLLQDMDYQPKFRAQQPNPFFRDDRAARPPIAGTIAVGFLRDDKPFFTGLKENREYVTSFPIQPTREALARGEERYNIYCAVCHGLNGGGNGPVNQRAINLRGAGGTIWSPAKTLVEGDVVKYPVGELFYVISNGVARPDGTYSMPGYAHAIPPADRWAIVLYMEAMQKAYNATLEEVAPEDRQTLADLSSGAPAAGDQQDADGKETTEEEAGGEEASDNVVQPAE